MALGLGQQLQTTWMRDPSVSYSDALIRSWIAPWTAPSSISDPVWENWWWGAGVISASILPFSSTQFFNQDVALVF